jgi:uncharacterized membrane protein YjgN (DUF898 family)
VENSDHRLKYDGTAGTYFPIFLKNVVLTILTLGIYGSWATTNNRNYFMGHREIAGGKMAWHGTGMELFIGRLKALLLIIIGYAVFLGLIFISNDEFGQPNPIFTLIAAVFFFAFIIFFAAIAFVGMMKYRLSRTSWNNIRFSFSGDYREFVKIFVKGYLLTLITLGLYIPFFTVKIYRWAYPKMHLGNKSFEFTGSGAELFKIYLKGIIFGLLTVGIYFFWYYKNVYNYVINNTNIDGATFKSNISAGDIFGLFIPNMLILFFTLGIGYPIVITRIQEFISEHITLDAAFDPNSVEAGTVDMETATGEGLFFLFDLDL